MDWCLLIILPQVIGVSAIVLVAAGMGIMGMDIGETNERL